MALSTVTLCFLVAVATLSKAQELKAGPIYTIKSNFPYEKQQEVRKVFETIYTQYPQNLLCNAWTSAFAKSLGRRVEEGAHCGCARIPGDQGAKGIYYFSEKFHYINLYVVDDETNWILAAPASWI